MFKNIKNNENKGFSLVELIVVIAIMAVLTSVLAPALLQYVERSRAQKDDSAMGEVTNAIKIALADQRAYDECLAHNIAIGESEGGTATGVPKGYVEDPDLKEGTYEFDAPQRGMTITFYPVESIMTLEDARINFARPDAADETNPGTLGGMSNLYGQVKASIGEDVKLTSQTYRNSEYTVFIRMSTVEDGVDVKGGWNGKNLATPVYTPATNP